MSVVNLLGRGRRERMGALILVAWGSSAACSTVFSSDDDCKVNRTCPFGEAGAFNAPVGGADGGGGGGEMMTAGGADDVAGGSSGCTEDADCDDGDDENGAESCNANGVCRPGDPRPFVLEVEPEDGDAGIAPDARIRITFSEELDESTVTEATIQILDGEVAVEADVTYAANVVTLTPRAPLSLLGKYQVVVSSEVTDIAGGGLDEEYRSTFQVRDGSWKVVDAYASIGSGLADRIPLDPEGNAVLAWDGPSARAFRHGVPQGNPKAFTPSGASVLLASNASGQTFMAWQSTTLQAFDWSRNRAEGAIGPVGAPLRGRLHVSPLGMVHLFQQDEVGTRVYKRPVEGGWLVEPDVLSTSVTALSAPEVAFDTLENGLAVWRVQNVPGADEMYFSLYSPATEVWTPAAPLEVGTFKGPSAAGRGPAPAIAASRDGTAVVLWVSQRVKGGPCDLLSLLLDGERGIGKLVADIAHIAVSCDDDPPGLVFDGEAFVAAFTGKEGVNPRATYTARLNFEKAEWGVYEKRQAEADAEATTRMPRLVTDGRGTMFLLWSTGAGPYGLEYQMYREGEWSPTAALPNSEFSSGYFLTGSDAVPPPPLPVSMNRAGMIVVAWAEQEDDASAFTKLRLASFQ